MSVSSRLPEIIQAVIKERIRFIVDEESAKASLVVKERIAQAAAEIGVEIACSKDNNRITESLEIRIVMDGQSVKL